MSKTALVTGASSGIGKATARSLAAAGFKVYGASRNVAKMQDLADEGISVIALDVADDASIVSAVNQILQQEGSIDILVNNAGYGEYGAVEDVALAKARYQLEVNLFGPVRLIQLVLPKMRENGWGKIVNITSIGGKIAAPLGGWYHASKFGLEGLSDALRNEVRAFGIDVVVIEPGAIKTEWGGIAVDNMQASVSAPYAEVARKTAQRFAKSGEHGSDPKVIADLVMEAVAAGQPKTRYVGGAFSQDILDARKHMTDEEFDAMITNF